MRACYEERLIPPWQGKQHLRGSACPHDHKKLNGCLTESDINTIMVCNRSLSHQGGTSGQASLLEWLLDDLFTAFGDVECPLRPEGCPGLLPSGRPAHFKALDAIGCPDPEIQRERTLRVVT